MSELGYWIAMSRVQGVGTGRLRQLKVHFGSLERAWKASLDELRRSGLDDPLSLELCDARKELSPESELEILHKYGVSGFMPNDPRYPRLLAETADSPPVLYVRGHLPEMDALSLAIVGTRRPTAYGRHVAGKLIDELVAAGSITVSGLARGIDTCVHRETLHQGGITVAVLAGGLDSIYPAENLELARKILETGALVSEHPPRTKLRREHFLRRNRIMSGITRGTVVVEAGERSGALATARNALDQNREVFAVPGSVLSPESAGTNGLIQRGEAKLIMSADDVLTEFGLSARSDTVVSLPPVQTDSVQSLLLGYIGSSPVHADELARELSLPSRDVIAALALLELQGIICNMGNMHYVITGRRLPEVA